MHHAPLDTLLQGFSLCIIPFWQLCLQGDQSYPYFSYSLNRTSLWIHSELVLIFYRRKYGKEKREGKKSKHRGQRKKDKGFLKNSEWFWTWELQRSYFFYVSWNFLEKSKRKIKFSFGINFEEPLGFWRGRGGSPQVYKVCSVRKDFRLRERLWDSSQ